MLTRQHWQALPPGPAARQRKGLRAPRQERRRERRSLQGWFVLNDNYNLVIEFHYDILKLNDIDLDRLDKQLHDTGDDDIIFIDDIAESEHDGFTGSLDVPEHDNDIYRPNHVYRDGINFHDGQPIGDREAEGEDEEVPRRRSD